MKRWKTLKDDLKSQHSGTSWKVGKWKRHEGAVSLCNAGYHCSFTILDAMSYVRPAWIARVEVRGESVADADGTKEVWSEMRVVRAQKWEKEDSVALAIYAAEQVLSIYEAEYPDDKRPREAIEVAKKWLKKPSKDSVRAATSAAYAAHSAATSAHSAAYATGYAARAATSAAYAAYAAAYSALSATSAAYAACSAAYAALSAACATQEKLKAKIERWIRRRLKAKESEVGA